MLEKLRQLAQTRNGKIIILGGAVALLALMFLLAFPDEETEKKDRKKKSATIKEEISPVTKVSLEKKKINVYTKIGNNGKIDPEEEFVKSRRKSVGRIDELRKKLGGPGGSSEVDSMENALNEQMELFADGDLSPIALLEKQLKKAIEEGNTAEVKRLQKDLQLIRSTMGGGLNMFSNNSDTSQEIKASSIDLAREQLEKALRSGDADAIEKAKRTLLSLGGSAEEIDALARDILLETFAKENSAEAMLEEALLEGSEESIERARKRLRELGYSEEQINSMLQKVTKNTAYKLLEEASISGDLKTLIKAIEQFRKLNYSEEEILEITKEARKIIGLKVLKRALKTHDPEKVKRAIRLLKSTIYTPREINELLALAKEEYAIELFTEALESKNPRKAADKVRELLKSLGYSDEEIEILFRKAKSQYIEQVLKKAIESNDKNAIEKARNLLKRKGFSQQDIDKTIENIKSNPSMSKEILSKAFEDIDLEALSDTKDKLLSLGYTEDELEKLAQESKDETANKMLIDALKTGSEKEMAEAIRKLQRLGYSDEEIRRMTQRATKEFAANNILSKALKGGNPLEIEEAIKRLRQLGLSDEEIEKIKKELEALNILEQAFIDGRPSALDVAVQKIKGMGFTKREIRKLVEKAEKHYLAKLNLKRAIENGEDADIEKAIEELKKLDYTEEQIQAMINQIIEDPESFLSKVLSTSDTEATKVATDKLRKLGYSEAEVNIFSRNVIKENIEKALSKGDGEEVKRLLALLEKTGLSKKETTRIIENILISQLNESIKKNEEEAIARIQKDLETYTAKDPQKIKILILKKRLNYALELGDQAAIDKYTYELIEAGMPLEEVNQLNSQAKRMIQSKKRKESLEKIKQFKEKSLKENYDYYAEKKKTAGKQTFPYVKFRAKFFRTQKLLPGFRITLIVSQPFRYRNAEFKRGDFIYGTAALSNSRLMVTITKLKDMPANLIGYDITDFQPGIYSESARNLWLQTQYAIFRNAMSEINNQASTVSVNSPLLGSTITFLGNWFSAQLDESLTPITVINGHELIFETGQRPEETEGLEDTNNNKKSDKGDQKKSKKQQSPYGFGMQLPSGMQDFMGSFMGDGQMNILENYQNILGGENSPFGAMFGGGSSNQNDDQSNNQDSNEEK